MFGAAEMLALILSEIDLSIGYTAGVGRVHDRRADRHPGRPALVAGIIGGLVVGFWASSRAR